MALTWKQAAIKQYLYRGFWRLLTFSIVLSRISDSNILKVTAAEQEEVNSGGDILLQCHFPCSQNVLLKEMIIEWIFSSNSTSHLVYYYNLRTNNTEINTIYQDRLQTFHRDSPCGNASLLFHDVHLNDTGTFTCHVFIKQRISPCKVHLTVLASNSGKADTETPTTESLEKPTDQPRRHWYFLVLAFVVMLIALCMICVRVCYLRRRHAHQLQVRNEEELREMAL
ncbi:V-set and immunoglobulin domain-containing protein 1-like isoform X2 [Polypterus senegalus]|nr:V-set and immunoglobulin domain-containing protein 1-like isoform X2 [Polypterus senegalus]XP_039591675.1 V-set and immunoglobulin domain-containing protein 1-like isoform X2 [Polypterus senegalus]XP_039591680.1 V-set and immunoglobulin domain-containing protein 1-like isoform X2 [Polypterus senegalus]